MGKTKFWQGIEVNGSVSYKETRLKVTAVGAITSGSFVVLHGDTNATGIYVAEATNTVNTGHLLMGYAPDAIANGTNGEIITKGLITIDADAAPAVGDRLYYDYSAGQRVSTTNPGTFSRFVGVAVDATDPVVMLLDLSGMEDSVAAGISSFIELGDTPSSIPANAGVIAGTNAGGAVEFVTASAENQVLMTDANNDPIFRDILDEDDMVSDSNTRLATQQSIKAYVDNTFATQLARVPKVDLLVYELAGSNQAGQPTSAPAGTAVVWAVLPSFLYYSISDGTNLGASAVLDVTLDVTRVILMNHGAATNITVNAGDVSESQNGIFVLTAARTFTGVKDAFEGMVTYVDITNTGGATNDTGQDAIFIDDDGTGQWELRTATVTAHTGLTESSLNTVGDASNTIPNQHQIRNSETDVGASQDFTIPAFCTVSYMIDRLWGSGSGDFSRVRRVGTVIVTDNEVSEVSGSDVISDIAGSGYPTNSDSVTISASTETLTFADSVTVTLPATVTLDITIAITPLS